MGKRVEVLLLGMCHFCESKTNRCLYPLSTPPTLSQEKPADFTKHPYQKILPYCSALTRAFDITSVPGIQRGCNRYQSGKPIKITSR
jgi:hypothetical protein